MLCLLLPVAEVEKFTQKNDSADLSKATNFEARMTMRFTKILYFRHKRPLFSLNTFNVAYNFTVKYHLDLK